jgi:hypothetical protein
MLSMLAVPAAYFATMRYLNRRPERLGVKYR